MREIKFRAWDKENGCWASIDSVALSDDGSVTYLLSEEDDMPPYFEDEVELMQYTGLDDVNGKPIYENDIVKVTSDDGAFYVATVKWLSDDGCPAFDLAGIPAAWCYDSNALATILESSIETCEVIGNVHENIELLEAEK